jgi:hypothetical protein
MAAKEEPNIFAEFDDPTEDIDALLAVAPATDPPQEKKYLPGAPGRTNPASFQLQQHAKTYTEEAFDVILDIARDVNVEPGVRLEAAKHIIDRGWGKPQMKATINSTHFNVHETLKVLSGQLTDAPKLSTLLDDRDSPNTVDAEEVEQQDA